MAKNDGHPSYKTIVKAQIKKATAEAERGGSNYPRNVNLNNKNPRNS